MAALRRVVLQLLFEQVLEMLFQARDSPTHLTK